MAFTVIYIAFKGHVQQGTSRNIRYLTTPYLFNNIKKNHLPNIPYSAIYIL